MAELHVINGDGEGKGEVKEWEWEFEVDQACGSIAFIQEYMNMVGDGRTDMDAGVAYQVARILGMVRGRLEDMEQGKPFVEIPGVV